MFQVGNIGHLPRNAAFLAIAMTVRLVSAAVVMVILARHLGADSFGKIGFALSFTAFFAIVADAGLSSYSVIHIPRDPQKARIFVGHALAMKFAIGAMAFICVYIAASLGGFTGVNRTITLLFGASLVADAFIDFTCSLYRGIEKMQHETTISLVRSSLAVCTMTVLVLGGAALVHICVAWLAVRIAAALASLLMLRRVFGKFNLSFDAEIWRQILRVSIVFGMYAFLVTVYNRIGVVLVSRFAGDAEAGCYQAALSLLALCVFAFDVVLSTITPLVARLYRENVERFRVAVAAFGKIYLAALLPILCFTYAFADDIVLLFYGVGFHQATMVLRILCVAYLFLYMPPLGIVLLAIGKEKVCLYAAVACVAITTLLTLCFAPRYGGPGAAVAFAAACMTLRFAYAIAYKRAGLSIFSQDYLRSAIAAVCLTWLFHHAYSGSLVVTAAAYISSYVVVAYFLVLDRETIQICSRLIATRHANQSLRP